MRAAQVRPRKRLTARRPLAPFGLLALAAAALFAFGCSSGDDADASATGGDGAGDQSGSTDISDLLNELLDPSSTGVLVRVPDGLGSNKFVPASFMRNDVYPPTGMYQGPPTVSAPAGTDGPQCTGTGNESDTDGYVDVTGFVIDWCASDSPPEDGSGLGGSDPYALAEVGVVVGKQFSRYDAGVYYPTDANVTDDRCHWSGGDPSNQECPDEDGSGGAGDEDGKGCHPKQTDAPGPDGVTLVSDPSCQCNADLSGNDWDDWIDHWLEYAQDSPNQQPGGDNSSYTFFEGNDESIPYYEQGGQDGKAPVFALDWASCWVSDVDDMVGLQNAFWTNRARWFNGLVPQAPAELQDFDEVDGMKYYWGWSEVPVPNSFDKNQDDWDAIVVKLPAGTSSTSDLSSDAQADLGAGLAEFVRSNGIEIGAPRSAYVLLLTEEYKGGDDDAWERRFACEAFDFTEAGISIEYLSKDDESSDGKGACYLDGQVETTSSTPDGGGSASGAAPSTTAASSTTAAPSTTAATPTESAPCTAEAIDAALPGGDTLNNFQCDSGYAVAFVTDASDQDDYTARLESSRGVWVENDNCDEFPASLQQACNTN